MTTKVEIIFLDKYITDRLDHMIEMYINHPRGKVISIALSFYFMQNKKVRNEYYEKAVNLIKHSSQIDFGNEYGSMRVDKVRTNLYVKEELSAKLKGTNKKVVVLASLIYVGLIKS